MLTDEDKACDALDQAWMGYFMGLPHCASALVAPGTKSMQALTSRSTQATDNFYSWLEKLLPSSNMTPCLKWQFISFDPLQHL